MTRPTILVVDDEPGVRAMLAAVLGDAGYRVLEAAGGTEALVLVRRLGRAEAPALVLTDLLMPGMDGFMLAAQLRLAAFTGPIVLMSSGSSISPMPDFPFVRKPFDLPHLRALLTEQIGDKDGSNQARPSS